MLKPRLLTKLSEMEAIISEATVCYVGMADETGPYVLPMNFAFESGRVFLHAAPEGHKLDIIRKNSAVCINFNIDNELFYRHKEVGCSWGMKFKSVNAHGKVRFIVDYQEKYRIMKLFMLKYAGQDYEFSEPSIRNVVVMQVDIEKLTGKVYGNR